MLFRGRAVAGPGCAAGGVASPRRGGAAGCLGASSPPRGFGLTLAPGGAAGCLGQAPSGPFCRRASSFRRRASACIAGVISSRLEEPPGCSAEAVRSGPRHLGRSRSSVVVAVALRLLRRGRSSVVASAEAPPWAVRAPEGVWATRCGVRRFSIRPEGWLERLRCRSAAGADTVCRFSVRPEGWLERLRCRSAAGADTVPLFGRARGPVRVPALPKRGGADTSQSTEVSWGPGPPRRFRGALAVARECDAAEGRAPKRLALGLPLRAEARCRELPVVGRGPGSGGGRVLSRVGGKPSVRSREPSSLWNAPGRRVPLRRGLGITIPERLCSRQRTTRRLCCR
mgnify:FL=1